MKSTYLKMLFISMLAISSSTIFSQFNNFGGQVETPATWSFSTEKIGDNLYNLVFTAEVKDGWYIYSTEIAEGGPMPTAIEFDQTDKYQVVGTPVEATKPKSKYDEVFEMNVGAHYNQAIIKQRVKLLQPGKIDITGLVSYQGCKDGTCTYDEPSFSISLTGIEKEVKKQESTSTNQKVEAIPEQTKEPEVSKDSSTESTPVKSIDTTSSTPETTVEKSGNTGTGKKKTSKTFLGMILLALGLGFASLTTPCVYPIIPLTVSFFTRADSRAKAIKDAVVFGLSITLIYSFLGFVVGLTGIDIPGLIARNWIANLVFFIIFILFAFSFFGLFEIMLPTSLSNKIDSRADKGGILGPFFMGLATVVISFSCTGPIATVVLGAATDGQILTPTFAMMAYGAAFALPFSLLAIFPSALKKMPKSGGWMNSIKVFFAFVMLAISMKFLSIVDVYLGLNLLSRPVFISIWISIFTLLGLYLLGIIKFSHDSELKHLGVFRLLVATGAFAFAIYLVPGLFGAKLEGLSSMLPPKSGQEFDLTSVTSHRKADINKGICGPASYTGKFHFPAGIKGYFDYEEALSCAEETGMPIFLEFTGISCSNCKVMEQKVISKPEISSILKEKYVVLALYTDDKTKLPEEKWVTSNYDGKVKKTLGRVNRDIEMTRFTTAATPLYVILDQDGEVKAGPKTYNDFDLDAEKFKAFLLEGLK